MLDSFIRQAVRCSCGGLVLAAVVLILACSPDVSAQRQRRGVPKADAASSKTLPALKTEVAFPNLRFNRPVVLTYPHDDSDLLFVVEQGGVIWSFPSDPETSDKQPFLDIRRQVLREGNEEGLLGLAFHPRYRQNGEFFVYYSTRGPAPRYSVVSRFRVSSDDHRRAVPTSEERIWVSDTQPFNNHNGGCIEFGPDGLLYISVGDGGAAGDPLVTGQDPRDWFGSILRIDVDNPSDSRPYGIPSDNPALHSGRHAHWAPEVYAIGLRNVWKFTFDRQTGTLWAGDVGQDLWEMVYLIENGGNYGWSLREGTRPFRPRARQRPDPAAPITPPVAEYSHQVGKSITGGYVYRGAELPELVGAYVFGDYETGRIWALREENGKATEVAELIDLRRREQPRLNVAAFGEDRDGEIYVLAFDGRIHRLVPR